MTTRPAARWCHAVTDLTDFALVTWAVEPDRVAALLPAGFAPDLRDGRALVSMVPFLDERFHFRALPFAPVSCGQVNYRAYVRHGDESGAWFFGTSLDSAFVALPRLAWKMPWHPTRLRVAATWIGDADDRDHCTSWRLDAIGAWGGASVGLRGAGRRLAPLPGFAGDDEWSRIHCDPLVGWYRRIGRNAPGVGRYSVWHEPLALEEAVVVEARCDLFTDLGLVEPGEAPLRGRPASGFFRRAHPARACTAALNPLSARDRVGLPAASRR